MLHLSGSIQNTLNHTCVIMKTYALRGRQLAIWCMTSFWASTVLFGGPLCFAAPDNARSVETRSSRHRGLRVRVSRGQIPTDAGLTPIPRPRKENQWVAQRGAVSPEARGDMSSNMLHPRPTARGNQQMDPDQSFNRLRGSEASASARHHQRGFICCHFRREPSGVVATLP